VARGRRGRAGKGRCGRVDAPLAARSRLLTQSDTLHLSSGAVGTIATVYLLGEVVGALLFGRMSEALGRRELFMVTLGVHLIGSGLTATAGAGWVAFLYATRFIAGMGIGGEYAAINSAIDEMIPARYRSRSTPASTAPTGPGRSGVSGPGRRCTCSRSRLGPGRATHPGPAV
jgi:MFS family permease